MTASQSDMFSFEIKVESSNNNVMKTIDFSYFIERYNDGEMSNAEKQWFQKELETNKNLRDEVYLRKKTDEVLKNQDIIVLRNKLSEIGRRKETNLPLKKTRKPVYLYYAAVIAVLAIIGSITISPGKNLSGDEILAKYYKPYEPQAPQRSVLSKENADFVLALDYFNTHDYKNAALLFKRVVESNPKNMEFSLLYGVASFEDKKYPEAEKSFVNVINEGKNLYIETAKWYLALCYIRTDETEKAFQQLDIIYKEHGLYRKEAKKIMRNLN